MSRAMVRKHPQPCNHGKGMNSHAVGQQVWQREKKENCVIWEYVSNNLTLKKNLAEEKMGSKSTYLSKTNI